MKKLRIPLSLLFFSMISLTGCFSGETHVKMNEDGSAKVTTTVMIDKGFSAMIDEEDPSEEMKRDAKKKGWSFEKVS